MSLTPAQKATRTRSARAAFQIEYPKTCDIARDILEGYDSEDVAHFNSATIETVAAVKANLNRPGAYQDMAVACNY